MSENFIVKRPKQVFWLCRPFQKCTCKIFIHILNFSPKHMINLIKNNSAILFITFVLFPLFSIGPLFQPIFGDEIPIIENSIRFITLKTFLTEHYSYPAFFSYLSTIFFLCAAPFLIIFNNISKQEIILNLTFPIYGTADINSEILILRIFPFVIGIATILFTYYIGLGVKNRQTGLIASLLLTLTNTFIYRSTLIIPDIFLALMTTITLWLCIKACKIKITSTAHNLPPKLLVYAAFTTGMATSTKYNGALIILSVYIATIYIYSKTYINCRGTIKSFVSSKLLIQLIKTLTILTLITISTFLILSPGWIIEPQKYIHGLIYESQHMQAGQIGIDWGEYPYLWIPMRFVQIENAIGVLFILGFIWTLFKRKIEYWILAIPLVVTIFIVGLWKYTSIHYILWCFPILAILSAKMLDDLCRSLNYYKPIAVITIALLCISPNLIKLTDNSISWLTMKSNLSVAEKWIETNIPSGSTIHQNWYGMPTIWDDKTKKTFMKRLARIPNPSPEIHAKITSKPTYRGYLGFQRDPPSITKLDEEAPEWILVNSILEISSPEPLVGYNSAQLIELHRKLGKYYDYINNSGNYIILHVFSEGPGPKIRVFHKS